MKKIMFMMVLTIVALTACQSASDKGVLSDGVYKGTLPAADGPGIVYELTLGADSVYTLDQTYLETSEETFTSTGKFVIESVPAEGSREAFDYIVLTEPDGMFPIFFKIVDGKTLLLLGEDLSEPQNTEIYQLKKEE